MKNHKKMFISLEIIMAAMVILLAYVMLKEKNGKDFQKVSVIIQNPDDNQWAAFKYGLKKAAEDQKVELSIISTEGKLTAEEEKNAIEREIDNGASAVIVQPIPGDDTEKMLKKVQKKVPVLLVEYTAAEDWNAAGLPTVGPDNYAMGIALAEELLKDYNGKIDGKTLGIFSETEESESVVNRGRGFRDALKDSGAEVVWSVSGSFAEGGDISLETQSKVDFVIALDDSSLTAAGEQSASNNLHGALVYGIGHSTEAVYYLDTGFAECLVVPDEFNVGYQSLTEIAESLGYSFDRVQNRKVSYTTIRRETLFSKENQEILFTMSQ